MEMAPVIPELDLVRGQHGLLGSHKTLQTELRAEDSVDMPIGEQSSDLGLDLLGREEWVALHQPLHLELDLIGYLRVHFTGAGSFLARCGSRDLSRSF